MTASEDNRLVLLMGPTASGKTALAIDLVARLNAEIVSVDSAMVYRDMDIGTAKPDAATQAIAPHALIDLRDPAETYSAAEFVADARREIARIRAAGRLPILTGGTSLYFRALTDGLSALPGRDEDVRARLSAEAETLGWAALHARLAEADPAVAARIHPNDAQRIQRMLEIMALTGERPSVLHARGTQGLAGQRLVRMVVCPASRAALHDRIEQRFSQMMSEGLLTEVEKLHARPDLDLSQPSMRSVGYRQLWQVLDGDLSLDDGVARGIIASRQLAKRQLTWLRSLADAHWLASDDDNNTARAEALIMRAGT
ncbi:tRNA (adenosine(37)-N6)-dimethylallyltransferase MiaA [Salinisphaera sp. Q1T1-3]|uniref:tRNA (adenosine(37)-N6)-dimethylallyltransferase MiaA n=1 Tax=Salinisphaera sp. Q1T1-3 TaxID=2321229 RepID=UPI000E756585|nr:tRNA (adenosine(37)-N6)-dimethylallyltransferase MiaA [Salinisphaera sp. Q1T1-3]RJS93791.1 tRNA (adenosine(37)-N6)-dimethylallyltransferase MiaA [Salinisphaera sp. Q1T1-3]